MQLIFTRKDPSKAYINTNVLIPKALVPNLEPLQGNLTFIHGEADIFDEDTGEHLGTEPGKLKLWDETRNHLIVPREFFAKEDQERLPFDFEDDRVQDFEEIDIEDHITLREDQVNAFEALLNHENGTLNLSCGKGKTVLALKLVATLKVPTIVIVNTTALLEQWKLEIEKHLGVESVGVVQGEQADWQDHPIVMAMVHTLSARREIWSMEFRCRFGLIIYDEGHHMSAPVFVRSADLFHGRRFSLTATATRTDRLEAIYQYHLGGVIHTNLEQSLIPRTHFHRLKWEFPKKDTPQVVDKSGEVSLPRVRTYLGRLDWRNEIIYEDLCHDLLEGRNILVLSHSVEHIKRLREPFIKSGGGMIIGQTPQEERMGILRHCNPVFGTFQLAREGLDKPELDTLYVVTPFGNSNDMQQAWGRIQRQYEGKNKPIVRVYEDTAFNCCVKSCRNLRSFLKDRKYPVRQIVINVEA